MYVYIYIYISDFRERGVQLRDSRFHNRLVACSSTSVESVSSWTLSKTSLLNWGLPLFGFGLE
jgi:hypothetical protein